MKEGLLVVFTGYSGAGKTTLARRLVEHLRKTHAEVLHFDFEPARAQCCAPLPVYGDIGFSALRHQRKVEALSESAALLSEHGVCCILSFISPDKAQRDRLRAGCCRARFCEIHVATPLAVCAARDTKSLYRPRNMGGWRVLLPGVDLPYQAPVAAEITINASTAGVEETAADLMSRFDAWRTFSAESGRMA